MWSVGLEDLFWSMGSCGLGLVWAQGELVALTAAQKGLLLSGSGRQVVIAPW